MNTTKYYSVKVEFTVEDDKGKIKKQKVVYLVDAMGCIEAETRISAYLVDQGEQNFEIKAVAASNIAEVISKECPPVFNDSPDGGLL